MAERIVVLATGARAMELATALEGTLVKLARSDVQYVLVANQAKGPDLRHLVLEACDTKAQPREHGRSSPHLPLHQRRRHRF